MRRGLAQMVLSQGLARGRCARLGPAIGRAARLCVHTLIASIGVTAMLASSDALSNIFKYTGAAYLFYLAGIAICSDAGGIPFSAGEGSTNDFLFDFCGCYSRAHRRFLGDNIGSGRRLTHGFTARLPQCR